MSTPPRLMYAGEFDRSGYAAAAKRYIQALETVGHPVAWRPLVNTHRGRVPTKRLEAAPEWMRQLPRVAEPESPTIWHSIPMAWHEMRAKYPKGTFIGQTVWEADIIPQRWHAELAPADQIWVPTEWNADAIRRSGITAPVHVVPHAVNYVAPEPPPIEIPADRTVFLTVAAWEWRKRPDLTLHAYLQAFTADDPVVLIIKTGERTVSWWTTALVETHTWWQVMDVVRQYPNPAEVVLVTDEWTDAQVAGLIAAAQCFVSLTAVEGWGLGAFDAAVAGVPVIITGHGGQVEWLGAHHPGLIPYRTVPAEHPDRTMFEPGMTWALAETDAAAAMMREVHSGRSAIINCAAALAHRLRESYSLERIGSKMAELTS